MATIYIIDIKERAPHSANMTIRAATPPDAERFQLLSVGSNLGRIDIESAGPLPFDDLDSKSPKCVVNGLRRYEYSIPSERVALEK